MGLVCRVVRPTVNPVVTESTCATLFQKSVFRSVHVGIPTDTGRISPTLLIRFLAVHLIAHGSTVPHEEAPTQLGGGFCQNRMLPGAPFTGCRAVSLGDPVGDLSVAQSVGLHAPEAVFDLVDLVHDRAAGGCCVCVHGSTVPHLATDTQPTRDWGRDRATGQGRATGYRAGLGVGLGDRVGLGVGVGVGVGTGTGTG